jgi:hypothetical protein
MDQWSCVDWRKKACRRIQALTVVQAMSGLLNDCRTDIVTSLASVKQWTMAGRKACKSSAIVVRIDDQIQCTDQDPLLIVDVKE